MMTRSRVSERGQVFFARVYVNQASERRAYLHDYARTRLRADLGVGRW
jgi:hypothetical protein